MRANGKAFVQGGLDSTKFNLIICPHFANAMLGDTY